MLDDGVLVHLGDDIHESAPWADEVRRHEGPEPMTLEKVPTRHALYKIDPDLQRWSASLPHVPGRFGCGPDPYASRVLE